MLLFMALSPKLCLCMNNSDPQIRYEYKIEYEYDFTFPEPFLLTSREGGCTIGVTHYYLKHANDI